MKLLLGTTNSAKVADYTKFLQHAELEIVTLGQLGIIDEPLEIGQTFKENALQKAKFYAGTTELPTLSDDGGFEVDFLDGRPGIDSNRWLGPNATDEDKINKILELLQGVPEKQRSARLKAVTVVYFLDVNDYVSSENSTEGAIPSKASSRVIKNFPYRSLLFLPEYNKYYSELNQNELAKTDHRKQICKELLLKIEPFLN